MLRVAFLGALTLSLWSPGFAAESQALSLWGTLGFTKARQDTGKKRTMVFARQGLQEKMVFTSCKDGDCPPAVRQEMLDRIAASLDKMPRFLQSTKIPMFQWIEQEEGVRPNGHADPSFGISLRTSRNEASFDLMVAHEFAHAFDEKNEKLVTAYHRIRYSSRQTQAGLDRLYAHINETNPGLQRGQTPKLDEETQRMFADLRLPRRSDMDLHAVEDGYEYWAVSVELYHQHRGDNEALAKYFSPGEQAFLEKLFSGK